MTTSNVIRFYGRSQPCFEFSNFFRSQYQLPDGRMAKTSEHGFQADKFLADAFVEVGAQQVSLQNLILMAETPARAAELGRNRSYPLRPDWEAFVQGAFGGKLRVKDICMLTHLRLKFSQDQHCREVLLGTGDAFLIEASPIDPYWGEGRDRRGKNMLGILLMHVRRELQAGMLLFDIAHL